MKQIFLSYADADEKWVIRFINQLKPELLHNIGDESSFSTWGKYNLRGIEDKIQTPKNKIADSSSMFVFLSKAYVNTIHVSEIDEFCKRNVNGQFYVIYLDRIDSLTPQYFENSFKRNFIEKYFFYWTKANTDKNYPIRHNSDHYFYLLRDLADKWIDFTFNDNGCQTHEKQEFMTKDELINIINSYPDNIQISLHKDNLYFDEETNILSINTGPMAN